MGVLREPGYRDTQPAPGADGRLLSRHDGEAVSWCPAMRWAGLGVGHRRAKAAENEPRVAGCKRRHGSSPAGLLKQLSQISL